jgi:hypothetical protein
MFSSQFPRNYILSSLYASVCLLFFPLPLLLHVLLFNLDWLSFPLSAIFLVRSFHLPSTFLLAQRWRIMTTLREMSAKNTKLFSEENTNKQNAPAILLLCSCVCTLFSSK